MASLNDIPNDLLIDAADETMPVQAARYPCPRAIT